MRTHDASQPKWNNRLSGTFTLALTNTKRCSMESQFVDHIIVMMPPYKHSHSNICEKDCSQMTTTTTRTALASAASGPSRTRHVIQAEPRTIFHITKFQCKSIWCSATLPFANDQTHQATQSAAFCSLHNRYRYSKFAYIYIGMDV